MTMNFRIDQTGASGLSIDRPGRSSAGSATLPEAGPTTCSCRPAPGTAPDRWW